jgi:hypothetical protein
LKCHANISEFYRRDSMIAKLLPKTEPQALIAFGRDAGGIMSAVPGADDYSVET